MLTPGQLRMISVSQLLPNISIAVTSVEPSVRRPNIIQQPVGSAKNRARRAGDAIRSITAEPSVKRAIGTGIKSAVGQPHNITFLLSRGEMNTILKLIHRIDPSDIRNGSIKAPLCHPNRRRWSRRLSRVVHDSHYRIPIKQHLCPRLHPQPPLSSPPSHPQAQHLYRNRQTRCYPLLPLSKGEKVA